MPRLGLGPDKGAAFGHEFADAYLAQVGETLGILNLADGAADGAPFALPRGVRASAPTAALAARWLAGPLDAAGALVDLSDRPLLCMDVSTDGHTAVIGGADHGLKEVGLRDARVRRELFSRTDGHREWVSCVRVLPDGRVLSGGVDAKLCLWDAGARSARCADLVGHGGSISAIRLSESAELALSASYDKTLRAWHLSRAGAPAATLRAHNAPVLELAWRGDALASGDRAGQLVRWDVATGRALSAPISAHRGHLTALDVAAEPAGGAPLVVSGGHDGAVRLWDARASAGAGAGAAAAGGRPALEATGVHTGAVNALCWHTLPSGAQLLVSAGADALIRLLEPRRSLAAVATCAQHRTHVYSLHCRADLAFSGAGDGVLLAHDLRTGACMWGLGANRAAVRCVHATDDSLVAAGDDGCALVFRFGEAAEPAEVRARAASGEAGAARAHQPSVATAAPRRLGPDAPGATCPAVLPASAAAASQGARAYADSRKQAMERAALIREQRRAEATGSGERGGDALDAFCARSGSRAGRAAGTGVVGAGPVGGTAAQSELDLLHAAGDAKFGRPRRRV
ncbi:hypothetical protein KFE25_003034 [Diacronema lutheri]|uniref:Guanine nucleotide-binding protein subunit beta-like protein n=4 Tax=Diacronema lutheri TaxID=2081491 RepID=A0A8J6C2I8_DIALT|nr:hypothetical protein KFE25_003034 [Diacronema lutheri]